MPIMEYRCSACGTKCEELFLGSEEVLDELRCRCGGPAPRLTVYRMRVIGPVFDQMEGWNRRLLSESERAQGVELKTYSDVLRKERELGLERMDRDGVAHRTQVEDLRDRANTMQRIRKEDGKHAVNNYIDRETWKEELGWDDTQAKLYQELSDAAERDFKADPSTFAAEAV